MAATADWRRGDAGRASRSSFASPLIGVSVTENQSGTEQASDSTEIGKRSISMPSLQIRFATVRWRWSWSRSNPMIPRPRVRGADNFALADELRRELGRPARSLAEQRKIKVLAQFSTMVRNTFAVSPGYLGDRLEAEDATAAELAESRRGVLRPSIAPSASSSSTTNHSADHPHPGPLPQRCRAHPGGDGGGQCGNFACPVGKNNTPPQPPFFRAAPSGPTGERTRVQPGAGIVYFNASIADAALPARNRTSFRCPPPGTARPKCRHHQPEFFEGAWINNRISSASLRFFTLNRLLDDGADTVRAYRSRLDPAHPSPV